MSAPEYRIQIFNMDGTGFAPGTLLAEFDKAKNIGWADYLNDVPEAFFTLSQDDSKLANVIAHRDTAAVKIYRDDDLVWSGFLGEWDANERDVIMYAYGHLGLFYFTHSDWNVAYTSAQINTIVSDQLAYSKALTNSLTAWITTGTVQAPVTTSGGATAISLPTYKLFWKRTLFTFRELAALAVGNTTNSVVFEVTPAGTFNFWKNLGQDRTLTLRYGDSRVSGFTESHAMIERRTQVNAAGQNPNDVTLRTTITGSNTATKGLRMEPIFFSWVRDATELDYVAKFRGAMLNRDVPDLQVQLHPNTLIPPRATGAAFVLGDRLPVAISRGVTSVSGNYMVRGAQVYVIRGTERVNLMLDERSGS